MTDGEVATPFPPRYRQLKRWLKFALIVLVLLAGVRAWWGYEAQRRLDRLVVDAHGRGQKILPGDFVSGDPVPPEQNGAPLLGAAARAIMLPQQQQLWDSGFRMVLPLTPADEFNIRALAWANRPSLDGVRKARGLAYADWGSQPSSKTIQVTLPQLSAQRELGTMLAYVTLYEHNTGNDADAVELLLDLDYQQSAVRKMAPYLTTAMTADGLSTLFTDQVFRIAPTLDAARPPQQQRRAKSATTRPAARERVRELIERLLDDSDIRRTTLDAWDGERMLGLDMVPNVARSMAPAMILPLVRPMYAIDGVRGARENSAHRGASTQPTLPGALAVLAAPQGLGGMKSHLHQAVTEFSELRKSPGAFHEAHFQVLADRRAAALIVAIRLHQLEHDGELPASLDVLVPNYLSRVPRDPMARDAQQPFGYLPQRRGPCVYSVGADARDDGGQATSPDRRTSRDAVYFIPRPRLRGSPPLPPPPATTRSGS